MSKPILLLAVVGFFALAACKKDSVPSIYGTYKLTSIGGGAFGVTGYISVDSVFLLHLKLGDRYSWTHNGRETEKGVFKLKTSTDQAGADSTIAFTTQYDSIYQEGFGRNGGMLYLTTTFTFGPVYVLEKQPN